MSKSTQLWCIASLVLSFLMLPSCQEEALIADTPNNLPIITAGNVNDLTKGYNVLIWEEDQLKDQKIELNTIELVEINSNVDGFSFRQIWENGQSYLVPEFNGEVQAGKPIAIDVQLSVKGKSDAGKTIRIFLRNCTKGRTGTNDILKERAAELMGYGIHIWGDVGAHGTGRILSEESTIAILDATTVSEQKHITYETSGYSLKESINQFGLGFSGNATFPIKKQAYTMVASGAVSGFENERNKSYYEYYMGFVGSRMAEAWLDVDALLSSGYQAHMNPTLNDALNNPGSNAYNKYSNDSTGITALLDYYGTDVLTEIVLGGYSIGLYGRMENLYSEEIQVDLDATINARKNEKALSKTDKVLEYLRTMNDVRDGGNGSMDLDIGHAKYESTAKVKTYTYINGGLETQDQDEWSATDNPEKWVIISYNRQAGVPGTAIPIEDFVIDKNSDRYKWIVYMLGDENYSPYFSTKSLFSKTENSRLVIADFMMKVGKDDHQSGDPDIFVGKGPDGVERVYYPLMANMYFPKASDKGYAAETSQSEFISAVDYEDHYWYYAMDHAEECNGIIGIKVTNDDITSSGYVRRGNHVDNNISGVLDNNYVWLKCGSDNTSNDQKITGIAIALRKDNNSYDNDRAIATTGGTDMDPSWTDAGVNYFNNYWEYFEDEKEDGFHGIGYNTRIYRGGLVTPNDLSLWYTFKPIERKYMKTADKPKRDKVYLPKKWGE